MKKILHFKMYLPTVEIFCTLKIKKFWAGGSGVQDPPPDSSHRRGQGNSPLRGGGMLDLVKVHSGVTPYLSAC